MAEGRRMTAAQAVDKLMSSEHADLVRESVRFMVAELMDAEVAQKFVVKYADYLDWDAFAHALARHVLYRNGERRNQRLITVERRRRIAA